MRVSELLSNDTSPRSGTVIMIVVSSRPQHATLISTLPHRTAISREDGSPSTCILSANEIKIRKSPMSRHRELIQHEDDQIVDTHATEERRKEDTEENDKLEWYIERTRPASREHAVFEIVCLQLKEPNSEANRKINDFKRQLHQDEPRTWFSPCPGCGRTDHEPVSTVRHPQPKQFLSERGSRCYMLGPSSIELAT